MFRIIHEDLRMFLNERMEGDGEDAELCYRIVARQDETDANAPNYFMAIPSQVDIKRAAISQTTYNAIIKAEIDIRSQRDVWNPTGGHRTAIRPGRWARAMTDIDNGNILDIFVMALDAKFGVREMQVELLSGSEIAKAYSGSNHCRCESIGDLANSCMRYDYGRNMFTIYERVARLAVVRCPQCKGIRARAVAWETDGKKYVDRRYGTQQNKQAILTFLTNQGYVDVWPGAVGIDPKRTYSLAFPYKMEDIPAAPYLDSLYNWCRTCKTLSNQGGSCTNKRHNLAVLRGQQGTNHGGWWGRCEDCGSALSTQRMCPNKRHCPACDEEYCTPECPNECVRCDACSTWRKKGDTECPGGCVRCDSCGIMNRKYHLSQSHGRCRGCGRAVIPDSPYRVKTAYDSYGNIAARCPNCDWRMVMKEFTPRSALEKCEHVHNGPYGFEGGHCGSCNAHIILEAPPEKKVLTEGARGYSFAKTISTNGYTVRWGYNPEGER